MLEAFLLCATILLAQEQASGPWQVRSPCDGHHAACLPAVYSGPARAGTGKGSVSRV